MRGVGASPSHPHLPDIDTPGCATCLGALIHPLHHSSLSKPDRTPQLDVRDVPFVNPLVDSREPYAEKVGDLRSCKKLLHSVHPTNLGLSLPAFSADSAHLLPCRFLQSRNLLPACRIAGLTQRHGFHCHQEHHTSSWLYPSVCAPGSG